MIPEIWRRINRRPLVEVTIVLSPLRSRGGFAGMSIRTAPYRAQLIALVLFSYLILSIGLFGSLIAQILIIGILPIVWSLVASSLLRQEQRQIEDQRERA